MDPAGPVALLFLGAGITKTTRPKDKLLAMMTWTRSWSPPAIKALGTAELLGAAGLVLPWATGIAKVLTPLAAVGLAIVMVGAKSCISGPRSTTWFRRPW